MQKNPKIDKGNAFDWGQASLDYAKYRDIYPEEFYLKIIELGLCTSGQRVLDLGTGTGVLPRNLYRFGAKWTGVDISENQINQARRLSEEEQMDISFFAAPAEQTGLEDNQFDVVTACQCFFYFDPQKVIPEIVRVLRPGGRLLILFMAWLPYESEIAGKSEELVLKYNPDWTGAGMKRKESAVPEWAQGQFTCRHVMDYAVDIPFTRESWHGRMLACRGTGASSLPKETIEAFRREHSGYMLTVPERFVIPHFVNLLDLEVIKKS